MALPIVKEYIKNLAKSVGYAAVDTTKMQAPAFKDFLETNEELFSDVYHGIRDITGTIDKAKKIVMDSQIYKTGDLAIHNAWEDIKTGKIYNKERENAVEDAAVDNMMGSDLDFGATESSGDAGESKSKKEEIPEGDKAIVSAVDSSMKASTIATGTAIASTGKYIATTNKAIANMQLASYGKMMNIMSSGFGAVTSGFQSLHSSISEGLKVQIDNQKTYFETTTKLIQEQNAMMKEMLEMQRGIYKKEAAKEKEGKGNTYEDVVTASGVPNLKAYGNAIWTNFKDIINEQTGGMGSMLNEDMLKALAANPLGGIAEFVVAGLMGNALKTNLKNFDKTLSSTFGNLISRFNYEGSRDDSGITGFISKVFGLKSSIKSSIRTDQYEKGSVPWSGKDSMSLQVVIPSYLSRIESALTGKKARLFDYDKGVFVLKDDTEKRFISQNKQYARSATGDVRSDVEKQLSAFGFDYETQKNLKNYLDNAFEQIYSDYGQFNTHDRTIVNRYKGNFNNNEELTKLFIKAMQNVDRDKRMQMAPEVMSQRQAQDQMMKRIEKDGTNPFINLYREFAAQNGSDPELKLWGKGSYKEGKIKDKISSISEGRIDKVTDVYKKTIFDYLRDINLTLHNIRELNAAGFAYGSSGGDTVDESNITINNMTKADIFAMPTENKAQRMRRARFISMYNRRVAQVRASQMASSSEYSNTFWNSYNRDNSERILGDKRRKTPTQENIDYENNQRASNDKRVEEKLRSGEFKLKFDGDNLGQAQGILDIIRKIKDAKNEEALNTQYNELAKLLHTRADRAKELANTLMGVNEGEQVELDENGKPVKRKREIGGFKVDEGGIVDKLMTAGGVMEKVKVIQDELASLVTRPTDALAGVIAKADEHIYDFFFSKDANETDDQGNRITGMFGYMKNELKKEFKHFNKWIDEEILQKLKDKFGGESAWEAAGNAIEKYTGFNPYKGALTLRDKIIGSKGEDGEREGGLLSNFLNKINEDVQNTLLNLRESVEEKINQPPKEDEETPSSRTTPAPAPVPLTMEEITQAHWSRDEKRTKKEYDNSLAELKAARENLLKFNDKVIDQSKKDKAHQLFELGGYDMVGIGLDYDASEALTSIEKNVNRINRLKDSDLRGYDSYTKVIIESAINDVQNILNNYPSSCIDTQTHKLRPLLEVVADKVEGYVNTGKLPLIIQKEILKIVSKFDDAEKVKLSDEESKKIDDKYKSMKDTAESDIAALEVQVEKTKKRAEWFIQQRKLEDELKKHQDQVKALIEEGKQRDAAISRIDAQRDSGELTREQYQIARRREDDKWTNPSVLRELLDGKEDYLKSKISKIQRDREAEGNREINNLLAVSPSRTRENIDNLIANGQFATGGVVPKTGLYFLSKDEQVIPTSHMEEDAARENALIAKLRKQYPNFNFEGQYAYGTGNPQPIFSDDTLKEHRYKEGEDGWWYNDLSQTYTKNINGKQVLREVTTRNDIDSKNAERFQEVPGDDGVNRLVDLETKETFVNIDGKWMRESEITKASQLKKGSTGNILGSLTRTSLGGAFNWITDKMKYDPEKDGNNKPMSRQAMDALRDGFSAVTENFLYGSDPKKTKEKLEQVKKETINAMPYAVSGGMMGFVPGLVMGAPFLGALVGAGLNVVNKSDTMSDWLFGARDENGERKDDGFISRDTQDMLKKYMPDVKLFGSIGSIAGLLTGLGPIPGLMIGGAAAFVKNNEEASNVLFGKDGLIGPHAKEKLKKAAPQIFAGAGAGALFGLLGGSLPVFGPLGLLGGLAAGAGLGLISTTDSFKDAILGPKDKEGKRHGGLVGSIRDAITDPIKGLGNKISGAFTRYIKEDLVGPVARSVAPFTKVLQLGVNKMFSAIGSAFSVGINKVLTPIKDYGMSLMQAVMQRTPLGRWLGKAGGFLKNGVAGIISAPSKLIGMAGDWTRQRLIQSGNAGDFMSSDEQLSFMNDRGIDGYKYKEMNQKLAGMNSMELERQLGNIDMMLDSNRNIEDERKKESNRFNSEIKANHHILPIERKKLIKLVKDGKIEEAHEYVMGLRLPQDEKRSIIESIEGHTNRMSDIDNFGDSSAQTEDMYSKLSESFGFEVNESNIHKLRAQLKTDIRSAKTDEEEIGTGSEELKAQLDSNSELKMQTDLLTEIRDRLDTLRGLQSGDLSRLKPGQRMDYDMQRDSTSWYRDNYDRAIDADSNIVNESVMSAFTRGRNLSEEEIAEYVVSDENRDILVNNSRNPNTPEKAERIRRLGEVNKLNLTPGQINLLIGTPDKEFKALIKTFELGFNLKEDDIVAILKCNRQLGGDRASTNLNILLDNNVPIYRLTDENGDAQKFLAVRKEVLDNMIRIRDEYLPDADAEALYEVYARHKNGLLADADTSDVNRILDRELGEDFRRGMERRTRDASIGRGENGDQERGENTAGSASRLFDAVHGIDNIGRFVHGSDITGTIGEAIINSPVVTIGSHAFGGLAKAGLNILSKGEQIVSTAKSGIDAVRNSAVFKGAKSVASGIYKAGKFVNNLVSNPVGTTADAVSSGYSALKRSLEKKAGENGEEGENNGEKVVNTDYGPMVYKKSMSGDYTLANTKDNVNIKNAIANRDNTQSSILSVLEEIRDNTRIKSSGPSEEKSGGGMGLLGMLGALATGIKKLFDSSLKIGKGIYKGIKGIFNLGKTFGKTAIRFFSKLLTKIGMTSAAEKLGGLGGDKAKTGGSKIKGKGRRVARFGRGAYGLGNPLIGLAGLNSTIGTGFDLFSTGNDSFDDDFDDVDLGDFSDESTGDYEDTSDESDFVDYAEKGLGVAEAVSMANDANDIRELWKKNNENNPTNRPDAPNTPESNRGSGFFDSAKQKIQASIDWGTDKLRSAGQSAKDAASSAWDSVKNSKVGKAVGGYIEQVKDQVIDKMKSVANFIVDKAPKISADKMKAFFDKILARVAKPEKLAKIAEKIAIKAGFNSAEAAAGAGTFGVGTAVLATGEIAFWFSQGVTNAAENFELDDGVEPTVGMRFISGIAEAFCGCTPVGYVLEGSDIIAIGKETLGEILGASDKVAKDLNDAIKTAQSEQAGMAAGVQSDYFKAENSAAKEENGDWFSSMKNSIANSYIGRKAAGAVGWAKEKLSNVAKGVKSFFGFGKLGPSDPTYGMGGFYSQKDPSISDIPFNVSGDTQKQTIGDSACGPAALMNVASALGKDKFGRGSGDLVKASMDALAYKEKDGGTKPGYFNAEANKLGFSTKKVPVSSVDSELDKGHPVIMMGQDPSVGAGMGKYGRGEPVYGPYPHYIAVTGKDDQGNYIVQDSEGSPNQRVSGKYLKEHSSLAMAGMGKWGRGSAVDEDPPFGSIAATLAKSVGSQHPELFWAQMMFETGGPDHIKESKWQEECHNYGGFTWYPSMGEEYKGPNRPSGEGGYYAKFKSDAEYADKAFNKVYKKYKDELAKADNPEDFASVLKKHDYYESSEAEYAAGLKALLNGKYKDKLSKLGGMAGQISTDSKAGNASTPGGKNYSGFFGGLQRIYDAFASIFSFGSSKAGGENGGKPGSDAASPGGGSGTKTQGHLTGDGNTMHIDAQTGGNCTIEATRAMVKAYLDRDEPKRNEQFSWWNPTLESDLQGKWVNFGNSATDKTNFENYIANHFAKKPGNPLFLYQTGGDGRNGSHPINKGQGDHATVIGRKLSNGKYEHYDSAGGVVKEFDLGDIFDPSARGGKQGMQPGEGNSIVEPGIDPSRPITNWEGSTPTAEPSSGQGKWGTGKWGRGELLNRLRATGSIWSGSGRAEELYKRHKSYNFSDVSGVDPDSNKYSIPYLVKKYNLQFDEYGNLKGVDIPDYNLINGTEDNTVKYAKQRAQIQHYAKNAYGTGKWGRGEKAPASFVDMISKKFKINRSIDENDEKNDGIQRDVKGEKKVFAQKFGTGKWGRGSLSPEGIYQYLINKGFSSNAAAGIMGNLQQESGFRSTAVQSSTGAPIDSDTMTIDGTTGYGLAQWTYITRQKGLHEFAQSRGVADSDAEMQLDYLIQELGSDNIAKLNAAGSPSEAARIFHSDFERSADDEKGIQRRANYAEEIFKNQGKGIAVEGKAQPGNGGNNGGNNNKSSGFSFLDKISEAAEKMAGKLKERLSAAFGNIKIPESFKKAYSSIFGGSFDILGSLFGGSASASPSPGAGGGGGGGATSEGIKSASQWAESVLNKAQDDKNPPYWYGTSGCTEFAKAYLEKAGVTHPDFNMYVPTMYNNAKAHGTLKGPDQPGAEGDVAIVRDDGSGEPCHAIIADGKGGYWGNSSGRHMIVHSNSITGDYNKLWGYLPTGSGSGTVSNDKLTRSNEEQHDDAGPTDGMGKFGRGKWGRGELLNRLRSTGSIWSGVGRAQELYKRHKSYDFSDVSGIDPDSNKYSIPYLVKKYNLQFDEMGNLLGVDIPDYNRIDGTESNTVKYAKQRAQIQYYAKDVYGNKDVASGSNEITKDIQSKEEKTLDAQTVPTPTTSISDNQELSKMNRSYDFSDVSGADKDFNKYSIPYVVKKYNLQFDGMGNLLGVDIPDYNRIDGTEDNVVKYAKQRAQIEYYAKNAYGTGKWGRGELLNRLRSTGSIWSGVGRAQELYKAHKSYDFSDVSGIDPDGNKYSIPYLVKKYNLQFDEMGNLKGVDIPDYNRIDGTESLQVKYAKQRAQIEYYAKDVYGNKDLASDSNKFTKDIKFSRPIMAGVDGSQELSKMNRSYDFSDVSGADKDFNKYSIPYVVKKYNLQFDEMGNLKGVDIPEYNLINGTEDNVVKYAKQRAQIQYYAKNVYGTGKWGRGSETDSLDSKYLNENIPSYNKIDLKNDSKTVIEAKKKAIDAWYATQNKSPLHDDRLEKAREASKGTENIKPTSKDDRSTLRKKTFLNTMINENIPSYNRIDYKNDSKNVIEAKLNAINKTRVQSNNPLHDMMISKSKTFPGYISNDIPEYNRIDYKNDSITVQRAKAMAQRKAGANRLQFKHGTGKGGIFDYINNKILGTARDFIFGKKKQTPLSEKISPAEKVETSKTETKKITNEDPRVTKLKEMARTIPKEFWDKYPYNRPDDWNRLNLTVDELKVKKMLKLWEREKATNPNWETDYTGVEDIPETIYTEVDESGNPLAPNGMKFEKNDIDYLLNNGYTKEDALRFLATDKKYTTKVESKISSSEDAAAKEAEEEEKAKKEREEYEAKQPGMAKMFGWDSHKRLEKYYEEKEKAEKLKAEQEKKAKETETKAVSNVEKLKKEQEKTKELKAEQEAQKAAETQAKETEVTKAEQSNVAAASIGGESYQEKVISLLTAAVQYLSIIAGGGNGEKPSDVSKQQNMTKMKSDLKDIINGTSNIGGISDLIGGSDMSSIMKTLNLVATR